MQMKKCSASDINLLQSMFCIQINMIYSFHQLIIIFFREIFKLINIQKFPSAISFASKFYRMFGNLRNKKKPFVFLKKLTRILG